jgi:hypothetical protein
LLNKLISQFLKQNSFTRSRFAQNKQIAIRILIRLPDGCLPTSLSGFARLYVIDKIWAGCQVQPDRNTILKRKSQRLLNSSFHSLQQLLAILIIILASRVNIFDIPNVEAPLNLLVLLLRHG